MAGESKVQLVNVPLGLVETANNQLVAVRQQQASVATVGLQGPTGATGPPGNVLAPIQFSWGDATPATIHTLAQAAIIVAVDVIFRTAFNGTGAALRVGITGAPELLMSAAQNAPAVVAQFGTSPGVELPAGTNLLLALTPGAGATQGAGVLLITLTPN